MIGNFFSGRKRILAEVQGMCYVKIVHARFGLLETPEKERILR